MRSSPIAVPAQKKAVSGVTRGSMGLVVLVGFAGVVGSWGGRNFGMRKSRVAAGVDHLGPVADHGEVDRVAGGAGPALPRRGQARGRRPDRIVGTHRGARGRPRPAVAMSSRWISFTPPPKVSTMLRLSWTSSQ